MKTTTLKCHHFAFETKKAFQLFYKLVKFQLEYKIICFALKHPVTSTLHRDDSTKIRFKGVCINGFKYNYA